MDPNPITRLSEPIAESNAFDKPETLESSEQTPATSAGNDNASVDVALEPSPTVADLGQPVIAPFEDSGGGPPVKSQFVEFGSASVSLSATSRQEPAVAAPHIPPSPPVSTTVNAAGATISNRVELVEESTVEEATFEQGSVQKLGIIGGKGVGKSYLFQAMVYRTGDSQKAGSLAYYLDSGGVRLFTALTRQDQVTELPLKEFLQNYSDWNRLLQTQLNMQRWYRLRLPYRVGVFGLGRAEIDVEFFDGSGEGFFQLEQVHNQQHKIWQIGYLDARVMVFCLPLWVAFPDAGQLSEADWEDRDTILKGFERVVLNYRKMRDRHKCSQPVRSILALTMADDRRSALRTLRDRWITPYMDAAERYLQRLRTGRGIALYLANARKISEALRDEFGKTDNLVSKIPTDLDFNGGQPWLIPLSAIEGRMLDTIEEGDKDPDKKRKRFRPPVPVHVELPLLVALCERENALM